VLLQDFDAAVSHDNPVFDRGRRTLFERSLKGRIHFRTILRMNKFRKAWTPGVKIGGVSLKYAVCLFGPGYVKTRQLGFPTAHFCHRLGLDQAGAFCLQLLCDLVLLPLTGSEGLLRPLPLRDVSRNGYDILPLQLHPSQIHFHRKRRSIFPPVRCLHNCESRLQQLVPHPLDPTFVAVRIDIGHRRRRTRLGSTRPCLRVLGVDDVAQRAGNGGPHRLLRGREIEAFLNAGDLRVVEHAARTTGGLMVRSTRRSSIGRASGCGSGRVDRRRSSFCRLLLGRRRRRWRGWSGRSFFSTGRRRYGRLGRWPRCDWRVERGGAEQVEVDGRRERRQGIRCRLGLRRAFEGGEPRRDGFHRRRSGGRR